MKAADRIIQQYELDEIDAKVSLYLKEKKYVTRSRFKQMFGVGARDTISIMNLLALRHVGRYWFRDIPDFLIAPSSANAGANFKARNPNSPSPSAENHLRMR